MEESKKISFKGIYVFMAVMLVAVVASLGVSAMVLYKTDKVLEASEPEVTKEDDVTIAGEYVIRSTKNISDAYKKNDTKGLSDRDKETLDMAAAVIDEVVTEGMEPFEKERAIYDWMCANLSFDAGVLTVIPSADGESDNPYGTLKYHNAICVGYATTFRLFMEMLDIPCMVVHNNDLYHSWDLVQLDGEWYHTDIYSDVGKGSYAHFNLNDTTMQQSWDREFFPEAKGIKYNQAYINSVESDSIYEIPALVRTALDGGESVIGIRFSDSLTDNEASHAVRIISRIQEILWEDSAYEDYFIENSWNEIEGGYLLSITINNSETIEGSLEDIAPEDRKKAVDALNDAFGDMAESSEESMNYDSMWDEATEDTKDYLPEEGIDIGDGGGMMIEEDTTYVYNFGGRL